MKKMVLLLILVVLAVPLAAGAHTWNSHDKHNVKISDGSTFEVDNGELTLTHKDRHGKDRVVVTEDGQLTVNGDQVSTNDSEQKLLRKFYRESAQLEAMALDIAKDAEKIASVSTKYASAQISAALRSLSDDDEDVDEEKMEAIEVKFEEEIERIEKFADKIENQADKVIAIGDELQERIPELEELEWFLDD